MTELPTEQDVRFYSKTGFSARKGRNILQRYVEYPLLLSLGTCHLSLAIHRQTKAKLFWYFILPWFHTLHVVNAAFYFIFQDSCFVTIKHLTCSQTEIAHCFAIFWALKTGRCKLNVICAFRKGVNFICITKKINWMDWKLLSLSCLQHLIRIYQKHLVVQLLNIVIKTTLENNTWFIEVSFSPRLMMELDDRCNLKVLSQTFLIFAEIHVVGFIKCSTFE